MAVAHYRIYELDPADHILAGYSVMCRSDAAALVAARRLGDKRATAVEVWESGRCVAHLSAPEASGLPVAQMLSVLVRSRPINEPTP